MLNEIQPLSKRRFLSTTRTTTSTVTATAAATPPTVPPTTEDIELGVVSDDAEVELAFKFKRLHICIHVHSIRVLFSFSSKQCVLKDNLL